MAPRTTAQLVRDVMTGAPLTLEATSTVTEAAKAMAGADVGPIPVIDENGVLCGLLTDRDIAVRVVAEDRSPSTTKVGDVASRDLVTLGPDASVDDAVQAMRDNALRRIPIVDDGRVVGIVSLGDLARYRDPSSVLADVSSAAPND
jgi:CBS domain-containing protein